MKKETLYIITYKVYIDRTKRYLEDISSNLRTKTKETTLEDMYMNLNDILGEFDLAWFDRIEIKESKVDKFFKEIGEDNPLAEAWNRIRSLEKTMEEQDKFIKECLEISNYRLREYSNLEAKYLEQKDLLLLYKELLHYWEKPTQTRLLKIIEEIKELEDE